MSKHNYILLQEKKPLGKESKNSLVPTQPPHSVIYSSEDMAVQRFSQRSSASGGRYSGLSSHGYSNGGSVYYPGQRHPDMLPGDEAL